MAIYGARSPQLSGHGNQKERVGCAAPFCAETMGQSYNEPFAEWLCPEHWGGVRLAQRRSYGKWKALVHSARVRERELPRVFARAEDEWARCKATAIEAAAGL